MSTNIDQIGGTIDIKSVAGEGSSVTIKIPLTLAIVSALIVEAAELVEHFQWLSEEESGHLAADKKQAVAEEMADILIYLTSLATRLDVDLLAAAEAKIVKNGQKYPALKVRGDARKYTEYDK